MCRDDMLGIGLVFACVWGSGCSLSFHRYDGTCAGAHLMDALDPIFVGVWWLDGMFSLLRGDRRRVGRGVVSVSELSSLLLLNTAACASSHVGRGTTRICFSVEIVSPDSCLALAWSLRNHAASAAVPW